MSKLLFIIFLFLTYHASAQTVKFVSYRTNDGLSNNYVDDIVQDKIGFIWIATRMGLNRYNGLQFKNYLNDTANNKSLPFNAILSLYVSNDNILWIGGYGSRVASFNWKTDSFTSYSFENKPGAKDLDVYTISSSSTGSICVHTASGVYSLQAGVFVKDVSENIINKNKDTLQVNNEMWIATNSGLKHISKTGKEALYNTENTADLFTNAFQSVFQDKEGTLWFGTHGGGLVQRRFQNNKLKHLTDRNIALKNTIICGFIKDSYNRLWVATDGGGISVFDDAFNLIKQVNSPAFPKSNSVLDFALDNDGLLWAAGWETGVFTIHQSSFEVTSYLNDFEKRGVSNRIKTIAIKGDTVYCGSHGDGLILLNRKTGTIISHKTGNKRSALKTQTMINDILIDSLGEIWIGAVRGLYKYSNNAMVYFPTDTADPYNTDKQMIWSICEDNNTNILITTVAGAYVLNKKKGCIEKMDSDYKTSLYLKFIFKDNRNHYWLGSNDNLTKIKDDNTFTSIKLLQTDRPIEIFNPGAVYQDKHSYIYIGTQDGFYRFHPDSLEMYEKAPGIILESFKRKYSVVVPGETSILKNHINETSLIELNYNDFPISISFASINFNNQFAIKYAYKLVGVDSAWSPIAGGNELVFHNLAPGTYTLLLRNTNKYGKWSETWRKLTIDIAPPFWKQWWFRFSVLTLSTVVILLLYRLRIRQMRLRQVELEMEVERKTLALQKQNEDIVHKKEKLEEQADILQEKLLELHNQKEELGLLNAELAEQSSELLSSNKQLSRAIHFKNKLLSIIAHDLKNPFTSIMLSAQKLSELEIGKETKEHSNFILSASKNVYAILSNMLDWAMSQSGLFPYSPVHFKVIDLLREIANNNMIFAKQKDIKLLVSGSEDIWCCADRQMIQIVIRNVIQNSLKFTNEGGAISLLCTTDGALVVIEVNDTGIGMDEDTVSSLFEIDSIISDKGTRDEEGQGLGLLVVMDFIQRNNGSINVQSKINNGTSFTIKLPKGIDNKSKNTSDIITNIPPIEQLSIENAATVLLVEDNDKLRKQLASSLAGQYNIVSCRNAMDAIAELKKTKVHVLISDIVMGDIDGITLCKTIKSELRLNIPVILITGIDDPSMETNAYNNGADAYIKKPFELSLLLARIQNLLSSQKDHWNNDFDFTKIIKSKDELFFKKLKKEIEKGIPDSEFSVELLAQRLGTSRTSLYRKMKKNMGISPNDYIQFTRLEVAAKLLKEKKYRVAEIAYMVGFADPLYFSNCFSKRYGESPTDFKSKH